MLGASLAVRLARYIDTSGGPDACHPWTGQTVRSRSGTRYGKIREGGRNSKWLLAHRAVLMQATGRTPPPTTQACHLCLQPNPLCCNERHLMWGSQAVNESHKRRTARSW